MVRRRIEASPGCSPPRSVTCGLRGAGGRGRREARKAEARAHFGRGVELVEQRAWAEALAEFVLSRKLHPTWKATKNAAACLAELGRDDEALDLLEALIREFPELPAQTKEEAEAASAKLRERVGVLAREEGEDGAAVVVDERYRGELPAAASLRVVTGVHVVRLIKDGFEPLEARVVVAGGQRVAASPERLQALVGAGAPPGRGGERPVRGGASSTAARSAARPGKATVATQAITSSGSAARRSSGRSAERRPRRGAARSAGGSAHRGAAPARGPPTARRRLADATLADRRRGVPVGPGAWEGRLRAAEHRIEVTAPGYEPARRDVRLAPGEAASVRVALERDPFASVWRRSPRIILELDAAAFVSPGLGGDVSRGCTRELHGKPRARRPARSVRGGVEPPLGALRVRPRRRRALAADQRTTGRATEPPARGPLTHAGRRRRHAQAARLRRGRVGAFTFEVSEGVLRLRLGAGALAGSLGDSRTGRFQPAGRAGPTPSARSGTRRAPSSSTSSPSCAAGLRVSRRLELTAAISAMVLFDVARPTWDARATRHERVFSDGAALFPAETLAGPVSVAFVPQGSQRAGSSGDLHHSFFDLDPRSWSGLTPSGRRRRRGCGGALPRRVAALADGRSRGVARTGCDGHGPRDPGTASPPRSARS